MDNIRIMYMLTYGNFLMHTLILNKSGYNCPVCSSVLHNCNLYVVGAERRDGV